MLTERQEQILDFIRSYQQTEGIPPSTREIRRHLGVSSQSTVMGHLQALARKGQLDKLADRKWGLRTKEVQAHLSEIPVFGAIPAGLPAMQEQAPDETIAVDPEVFGVRRPKRLQLWALRVRGDSMIGAHILDGDLAVLERREPRPGDIIAALVDGTDSTLKRLVQVDDKPVLRAENPRYGDIIPSQRLECQGVLVGVIRRNRA
jgi:repressor LexA